MAERIDALACFLPLLEGPGASGEWAGGETRADGAITMPWFEYSEVAVAFRRACYANGWVDSQFRWRDWQQEAQRFIDHPELITELELSTLQHLLTNHLRADRFNEGHLAAAIASGHIAAILLRLSVIRESLP